MKPAYGGINNDTSHRVALPAAIAMKHLLPKLNVRRTKKPCTRYKKIEKNYVHKLVHALTIVGL